MNGKRLTALCLAFILSMSVIACQKTEEVEAEEVINAGEYRVTVSFVGDADHEEIADAEVTLTIGKAVYDITSIINRRY